MYNLSSKLRRTVASTAIVASLAGLLFGTQAQAVPTSSAWLPHLNAAWVYDPKGPDGTFEAGYFSSAINHYNLIANGGHKIREVYAYGGDMQLHCPYNNPSLCTASDLIVHYARTVQVPNIGYSNPLVYAYHNDVSYYDAGGISYEVPIIDGTISSGGYLVGFDQLSKSNAYAFADKLAREVCSDPYAAGIQFDLEPLNIAANNGQYYFYMRMAYDLSHNAQGCVTGRYSNGRFFSIFGGNRWINPAGPSANLVKQILTTYHNGYFVNPLYDLASKPAGYRMSNSDYMTLVDSQTHNTVRWADQLGIPYQFGIPGGASYHEYETCQGSACQGAPRPTYGQESYIMDDENAIDASGARNDKLFLGSAVFSFTTHLGFGNTTFGATQPTAAVENYLAGTM